ncbi:ATP-binding cassette domain-containing protein [Georgenia sp. SYP-B2076]|uniref:ATP-binding cassette domain-containing protein n=1 Tax=Georgenia sp. SYP-B2076 TaxID=2495881 RepID=UPI000F8E5163|nr:ATP-binding cassette domain-containing protein [Georgenia sp. SYP-B2076]
MATPLLELRGVTKSFGPKVANDRVSLTVEPGRVHALVGENGAGKTTLMTMIAGTARPDDGTIVFDGRAVDITSPQVASGLGIGMVHQHFKLVPSLTVAANVFLGRELRTRAGVLDTDAMEAQVAALGKRFGLDIAPRARVADLSVGVRQRVEVLKALSHDTRLLILDEPTAVLTPGETDELFVVIRSLAERGCAVLFISHKLGEVLQIADEVTVIRDGRTIDTLPAAGLSQADIAQMMVGREVLLRIDHTPATPGEEVLAVEDLRVVDGRGVTVVDNLSLSVRAGEIVGIAGVEGNGQSELSAAIAGMQPVDGGRVRLRGTDITTASVARRRHAGLAYIPEDRQEVGSGPTLSVAENIAPTHLRAPVARHGWISNRGMHAFARELIARFDVRGASSATPIGTLSGGNVQKVVIAREFSTDPDLLMVSQPTRGVDVGAMEFVHNAVVVRRDKGAGVLLISADLGEVMSLSDRLLVMFRGQIVAEFTQETMSEAAVGLAMAGTRPSEQKVAEAVAAHEEVVALVSAQDGGDTSLLVGDTSSPRGDTSLADGVGTAPAASSPAELPAGRHAAASPAAASAARPAAGTAATDTDAAGRTEGAVGTERGDGTGRRLRLGVDRLLHASVQPVVAILFSLLVGAVIILALGESPLRAYGELFFSSFRSPQGIGALVAQFIPLVVLSAAVIISFRAGFFNIGGEGQLYIGAFTGALAGFTFTSLPGPLLTLVVLVFGMLGGLIWGLIPGALLAFWRVDIIVTTLMMSSIAIRLTAYLVTGPFQDPTAGLAASEKIAPQALFTIFSPPLGIGTDLLVALVAVVVLGLVLTRSVWGLKVRQLGEMNRFAEYTGVSTKAMSMQVMALSGAFSGLAGAIFVLGPNGGRFLQTFSPGYGFLGITVALLARLNPWAAIVAAAFYANMMAGSNAMQINTAVPFPLVNVLQGLIILTITAVFVIDRRTRRRVLGLVRGRRGTGGAAASGAQTGKPAPASPPDGREAPGVPPPGSPDPAPEGADEKPATTRRGEI